MIKRSHHQLLVIGGGAAGMAAAASAYDHGIADIVVLERESEPGGILRQCIHNGFGLHRYKEELTGPEYALREYHNLRKRKLDIRFDSTVINLTDAKCATVVSSQGLEEIQADAVVLAMGSRERTRGMLNIAGTRPAGIYTAGTAQQMINLHGILPGKNVVMLGSGDIGLIVARRLAYEGVNVRMVLNRSHFSGGLKRNIAQCLDDYGIPLRLSHTITAVHGKERLTGVTVCAVDPATKKPIAGTEEHVDCDTLLLSCGLIPENELSRKAGVALDRKSNGARVDETFQTNIPGIFSAGNVLHIHDLVDYVSEEGDAAGAAAAACIKRQTSSDANAQDSSPHGHETAQPQAPTITVAGTGVNYVVPQSVQADAQGKITFRFRCKDIFRTAEIHVVADGHEIKTLKRRVMLPAEMETVKLDASLFKGVRTLEFNLTAQSSGPAEHMQPTNEETADGTQVSLTCISCPLGCEITASLQNGKVVATQGATCKRGEAYAQAELENPQRMVTSLVSVYQCEMPLSVRTDAPVPKELIPNIVKKLRQTAVMPPIYQGQVIAANIFNTGANIVATKDIFNAHA